MSDHGKRASYNAGCRCDECVKAHRVYMREYMRGARERSLRAREELSRRRAERRAEYRDKIQP
jgi:hypothetical protein